MIHGITYNSVFGIPFSFVPSESNMDYSLSPKYFIL